MQVSRHFKTATRLLFRSFASLENLLSFLISLQATSGVPHQVFRFYKTTWTNINDAGHGGFSFNIHRLQVFMLIIFA